MNIDKINKDSMSIGDQISGDAKRRIFMKFIDLYGVDAAYGAGMTMTIDHPFKDYLGVFGPIDHLIGQAFIADCWRGLCNGKYDFDYTNPFIYYLATAELFKENHDGR